MMRAIRSHKSVLSLFVMISLVTFSTQAQAEIYQFTGVIPEGTDIPEDIQDQVKIGNSWIASFEIKDTTDSDPADNFGQYAGSILSASLEVGTLETSSSSLSTKNTLVWNGEQSVDGVACDTGGDGVGNWIGTNEGLWAGTWNKDLSTLLTDKLPTVPTSFVQDEIGSSLILQYRTKAGNTLNVFSAAGENPSVQFTVVPEPSTVTLCFIAGIFCLGIGWRKRRQAA